MPGLSLPTDLKTKEILSFLRSDLETVSTRLFVAGVDEAIRRHEFVDARAPASRPSGPSKPAQGFPKLIIFASGSAGVGGLALIWCLDGQTGCDGGLCGFCYLIGMAFGAIAVIAVLLWLALKVFLLLEARLNAPKNVEPRRTFPLTPTERVEAVRLLLKGGELSEVAALWGVTEESVRAWWNVGIDGGSLALKRSEARF